MIQKWKNKQINYNNIKIKLFVKKHYLKTKQLNVFVFIIQSIFLFVNTKFFAWKCVCMYLNITRIMKVLIQKNVNYISNSGSTF